MLLFIDMFGVSAHLHDVLGMHRHEVIREALARLQQKSRYQRTAFLVGEALEVGGTIAFRQLAEVVKENGRASLRFKHIDAGLGDDAVTFQVGLHRGDSGCRWLVLEGGKV